MADVPPVSRFLAGLAPADAEMVLAAASPRRFRTGAIVTHQGAPAVELSLITEGRARHFVMTPEGKKVLMLWLGPGDVYGGAALLPQPSMYRVSTEVLKDTAVLVWSRAAIRKLASRQPRILDNALSIAADYIDWYLSAHIALSTHTARQRLASALMALAAVVGRAVPDGIELEVTNEELAGAAHITPFTASRLLNEWQRNRTVVKRRGKVLLRTPRLSTRIA